MLLKLLTLAIGLCFSISAKADTIDNYQIYIRKVLVRNDSGFPGNQKNQSFIEIDNSLLNDSLEVHFNHCMNSVGKRRIVVVDTNSTKIKVFDFVTTYERRGMYIPISFFCNDPQIKTGISYSLIYYEDEMKEGRFLTDIKVKK